METAEEIEHVAAQQAPAPSATAGASLRLPRSEAATSDVLHALSHPSSPSTLANAVDQFAQEAVEDDDWPARRTAIWTEAARSLLLRLLASPNDMDTNLAQLTTQHFPQLDELLPEFTLVPASRERDWMVAPRHAARGGGSCLRSLFTSELHTELLLVISCQSTPQNYTGDVISSAQYHAAILHALLIGRMLISHQWESYIFDVLQDVLVRTLFIGSFEQTPTAGVFIAALFDTCAAELHELFTRRAGQGMEYVWYDDKITRLDAQWGWRELWSSFKTTAHNASERIHPYVRQAQLATLARLGEEPTRKSLEAARLGSEELFALHWDFTDAHKKDL